MHLAALVEIQQAPGRGNQDVAEFRFQQLELLVEVHAADEAHHVQVGVLGQVQRVIGDLHHEFTGRRDDQCARFAHIAVPRRWSVEQLCDGGDEKRSRLACAGLGAANGISAGEGIAEHLGLDRRAVGKTQVMNCVHQLGCELEVVEAGLAFGRFDLEVLQLPRRSGGFWRLAAALTARLFGGALSRLRLGLSIRRRCLLRGAVLALVVGGAHVIGCAGPYIWGLAKDFLECFEHGLLVIY